MTVRPHEALGQHPPARVYVASPRPYPARLEDPWYDATHQVRRVNPNGQIKWQGELVFVSEAVRGELVGLAETARGDWTRALHARRTGADRSAHAPVYAGVARPTARDEAHRPAMEMTSPWKSQTDFPPGLGNLATPARFPHSHSWQSLCDRRTTPNSVTHVSGLICYRCFRLRRRKAPPPPPSTHHAG